MFNLSRKMKRMLAVVLVETIVATNVFVSYAEEDHSIMCQMTVEEADAAAAKEEEKAAEESSSEESIQESIEEKNVEIPDSDEVQEVEETPEVLDQQEQTEDTAEECACGDIACTPEEYNENCPVCDKIIDFETDEEKEAYLEEKCCAAVKSSEQGEVPKAEVPEEETPDPTAAVETTEEPNALTTATPEASEMPSVSPKSLEKPSSSPVISASPSVSPSELTDASASPSTSASISPSISPSASVSVSPSITPSASPSASPELEVTLSGDVSQKASRMIFSKTVNMKYSITVKNTSDADAEDIEVKAVIPSIITIDNNAGANISENTYIWTVDELKAGKKATISFSGYINENTDNVENLTGRFYINGEKIEDVDFSGEWRLLEPSTTEGPTSISTVCDGVSINVSAADGSILPPGVEVKATRVSADSSIAAIEETNDVTVKEALAFDVVLLVGGEEVQPDGSVVVTFSDVPLSVEGSDTLGVAHIADNGSVEATNGGSTESVSIEANHFSLYVVYISEKYTPHNGVTTSNGEGLACFDFHVFANIYTSNYGGHINGNFAIKDIRGNVVGDFNPNNSDKIDASKMVFYVEKLSAWSTKTAEQGGTIVFGPNIKVSEEYGNIYAEENGTKVLVGSVGIFGNRVFKSDLNYIDFESEFSKAKEYSTELNNKTEENDSREIAEVKNTGDYQNRHLLFEASTDADEVVYNMNPEDLQAGSTVASITFNAKKTGQKFIINVKLKAGESYTFNTNSAAYKFDDKSYGNSEDNAYYSGNVIWNFVNEDGTPFNGKLIIGSSVWFGSILAPAAEVSFGKVNGSVVANEVTKLEGESHKGDYSSSKISYTVTKKWEGNIRSNVIVALYRRIRNNDGSFADGGKLDRSNVADTTKYEFINRATIDCTSDSSKNQFSYTFSELPSSDQNGYNCDYFVVEENVPEGYNVSYSGRVILNTPVNEKDCSVTLQAVKTLTGRELNTGEFSFELKDQAGNVLQTKTNDGNGDIVFDELEYTSAGEYNYTISEKAGTLGGITYSTKKVNVKVTVTDNENGQLVAGVSYDGSGTVPEFINDYSSKEANATLQAKKTLSGRSLKNGEFSFVLKDKDGKEIERVTNQGAAVTFTTLKYTKAGTYTYTISEVTGSTDTGITYDTKEVTAVVTVKDDGNGQLNASVSYNNGSDIPTFENSYKAEGAFELNGTKAIKNRNFADGDSWTFTVTSNDPEAPMPEKTTATISPREGKEAAFSFGTIYYGVKDIGKTYEYKVKESGNIEGVTNDSGEHIVTVKVSDNGDGTLKTEVSYSDKGFLGLVQGLKFTNVYNRSGKYNLVAHKMIEGRTFKFGDSWTFTVTSNNPEAPMPEKTEVTINPFTGSNADVKFGDIIYSEKDVDQEYTYVITETKGNAEGIIYDEGSYAVKVAITADDDGKMLITPTYSNENGLTFTNKYTAVGETDIHCVKTISGRDFIEGDEWTFTLIPQTEGAPMPANVSATIHPTEADGNLKEVQFGPIKFNLTDVGTYVYSVVETGEVNGVVNDANVHTVIITVKDGGNGSLDIETKYSDGDSVRFVNTYSTETPTPTPSESPSTTPTPTPGNNPTPTPGDNPTPTPGDNPTPTPGDNPTSTPGGFDNPPDEQVLGARRVQDNAVLGARRGSDFAVLGKRRRPQTGDSMAMILWLIALGAAAGGTAVSVVKLNQTKKRRK